MRLASVLGLPLLLSSLPSQVPYRYLVTAENAANASGSGMRFVDPATGVATDVRPVPGGVRLTLGRAATVTIDQGAPDSIPFVSGLSTTIAPAFQRAAVQGSQHTATTNHLMTGALGAPIRIEWTPVGMLAAIGAGTRPGLWQAPLGGGAAVQLVALSGAYDVSVAGALAYVASWRAGAPTQIDEVNLGTGAPRTLGASYPALRAIFAVPGVGLYAGTDAGDLLLIDFASGAVLSSRSLLSTAILALAGDATGTLYALGDTGEVYDTAAPGVPVYRGTQRVNDIAYGTVDLASFLIHGTGCGSAAVPGHQAASGVPSVGNGSFVVALVGGQPLAPAVFLFGGSRTSFLGAPLPLPLDFLQMTGCSLYTDVIVSAGTSLDASGNGSVPLRIPNAPRLRGTHFTTQWISVDRQANPAGVVSSDGGEGIIR
jgi:hypothetical protein